MTPPTDISQESIRVQQKNILKLLVIQIALEIHKTKKRAKTLNFS